METREVLGAVEGGGTKFVCMIGTGPDDVIDQITIPTTVPEETIGAAIEFLARPRPGLRLVSVGVATFGPICLDRSSPEYGWTLPTTKPHWSGVKIIPPMQRR